MNGVRAGSRVSQSNWSSKDLQREEKEEGGKEIAADEKSLIWMARDTIFLLPRSR
jgi:hypothetical protein